MSTYILIFGKTEKYVSGRYVDDTIVHFTDEPIQLLKEKYEGRIILLNVNVNYHQFVKYKVSTIVFSQSYNKASIFKEEMMQFLN